MLAIETFHSRYSVYDVCMQAASGRLRDTIPPFIKTLNKDAALTFSRQGPYILTLPAETQSRILMFLCWLCCRGLVEDGLGDVRELASRLTDSVDAEDVSIPPLCLALITALSSHSMVKKGLKAMPKATASRDPDGQPYTEPVLDSARLAPRESLGRASGPRHSSDVCDLQPARDWVSSGCLNDMPAEAGAGLSEAFFRDPSSVVEVFRPCTDTSLLHIARMDSSAAKGLVCDWPTLLHRCILLPALRSESCSGSTVFSAALAAAAAANTETCVTELLTPFLQQQQITADQERAIAPVLLSLPVQQATHLLHMLCKEPSNLQSPSKCAISSQLLNAIASARRGSHCTSPCEGSSGTIAVAQTVSLFLKTGVQACQPVPQPGAHTNALCDLAQQTAQLACEQGGKDAAARVAVGAVLAELLAAVQMLKGMRRNALVRRLQALQSSNSDRAC